MVFKDQDIKVQERRVELEKFLNMVHLVVE